MKNKILQRLKKALRCVTDFLRITKPIIPEIPHEEFMDAMRRLVWREEASINYYNYQQKLKTDE